MLQAICVALHAICKALNATYSPSHPHLAIPEAILLVTSPRTGSTWLLDILAGASTSVHTHSNLFQLDLELYAQGEALNPVFGNYGEQGWMQNRLWPRWLQRWRSQLHLKATLASPQLWCQLTQALMPLQAKLFRLQRVVPVVKVFQEQLAYHRLTLCDVRRDWPCMVLYREDMPRCYLSLVKAFSTNRWCRVNTTFSDSYRLPGQEYQLSFEAWLDAAYEDWQLLLEGLACDVHLDPHLQRMAVRTAAATPSTLSVLSYEQLARAPQASAQAVLRRAFGAPLPWQWTPTWLMKQGE